MIREFFRYTRAQRKVSKLMRLDSAEVTKHFLLDSRLAEAQQLSALLGLPEITQEDITASEARSRRVSHLLPLVAYFSATLMSSVMEYYDTVSPWKNDLTPEERTAMEVWMSKVSMSCVLGVITQLNDLDLIKVES